MAYWMHDQTLSVGARVSRTLLEGRGCISKGMIISKHMRHGMSMVQSASLRMHLPYMGQPTHQQTL